MIKIREVEKYEHIKIREGGEDKDNRQGRGEKRKMTSETYVMMKKRTR